MNNYGHTFFNPAFSHIYIEEKAADCVETKAVLSKFPHARRIVVRHYKDVFCRSHQEFSLQKKSPNLILAKRDTPCLYEGGKAVPRLWIFTFLLHFQRDELCLRL